MALHLIPDDGAGHVAAVDCLCRPELVDAATGDGYRRLAWQHRSDGAEVAGHPGVPQPAAAEDVPA